MSHGTATIAVFAHRGDAGAVALAALLRRRARTDVILAHEDTVARAVITHRPSSGRRTADSDALSREGDRMLLPDGRVIDGSTESIVWRLSTLPTPALADAHRDYAEAEAYALGLSWVHGLGDAVVNRPDSRTLAGAQPDLVRLAHLARIHGIAMPAFALTSSDAGAGLGLAARPWPDARTPIEVPHGREDDGPRIAAPRLRAEPVTPIGAALVLGDEVVAPSGDLGDFAVDRLADLVHDLGLAVAETMLARRDVDGTVVMTGLHVVPLLSDPTLTEAFAEFVEARALSRRASAAAAKAVAA